MVFIYLALAFALPALYIWRRNIKIYLVYGFSLSIILAYALVVTNVGTLHRMRYGYLMLLVACGVAAALQLYQWRRKKLSEQEGRLIEP